MVEGLNPNNSMALENEALYGAIDQRMNQFTADVGRTTNETIQELKREVNQLKKVNESPVYESDSSPGSLYAQAYNQNREPEPVEEVATDVYGEPIDVNEPYIDQGGAPGPDEGEFTIEDMKTATTQELLEAKRMYDSQRGKFTDFGEALEQELLKRGTVPDQTDLINAEEIDPDYIGESNETLIKEMKQAEKKNNRPKSLWDQPPKEEDILDAPSLDELSKEEPIKDVVAKPVTVIEAKEQLTPEDETVLEEQDVEKMDLDEETEAKLQNLLQKKIEEPETTTNQTEESNQEKAPQESKENTQTKSKPKKKAKKDQAPS